MAKANLQGPILWDADGDVEDVTVGDFLVEILDVDANITADATYRSLKPSQVRSFLRI